MARRKKEEEKTLFEVLKDDDPFAQAVVVTAEIKSDLPLPAEMTPDQRNAARMGMEAVAETREAVTKMEERAAAGEGATALDEFIQEGRPGGQVPPIPEALAGVAEHVFSVDVDAEYRRLQESLELGPKRHDKGAVREALDRVERDTICAARIHRVARSHEERFELEMRERMAALRDEARRNLEAEKKAGTRAKQITEGDVEDFCIANFGDEWRAMQDNRNRVHGTCRVLEELVRAYQSRQATVRLLASD